MFDKKKYYQGYSPKYYAKNKEKLLAYQRKLRAENPERTMLNKARARAKELGREFDITREDIVIPETCPILEIKLQRNYGKVSNNSPVLDRVDNSKGYVRGNICVISQRANQLKSDLSIEQVEKLLNYMRR